MVVASLARAKGAILLAAPNALFTLLSTGLGAPWSMSFAGTMDSSSPIGSLLSGQSGGGMLSGRTGGSGSGGFTPPHSTMSLADATSGSLTVRLAMLLCVLAVLFACGVMTAAHTSVPSGFSALHPYE
ncbi:hypothetical protein [Streptomyces canus]|uniref:hypothetical protein n=1 Tax=Streptomyces canus TaxID=58343 RepID=UPI00324ABFF8